jgi:hypothetical protein
MSKEINRPEMQNVADYKVNALAIDALVIDDIEITPQVYSDRVDVYRGPATPPPLTQTMLAYFEPDSIIKYVNESWMQFLNVVPVPPPFVWQFAISPIYKKDGANQNQLSFALLPVIVDTSVIPHVVYDYYECRKAGPATPHGKLFAGYYEVLEKTVFDATRRISFIYDESHLWP